MQSPFTYIPIRWHEPLRELFTEQTPNTFHQKSCFVNPGILINTTRLNAIIFMGIILKITQPMDPKRPWKMKVLNPQYRGLITPKNEGNVGSHGTNQGGPFSQGQPTEGEPNPPVTSPPASTNSRHSRGFQGCLEASLVPKREVQRSRSPNRGCVSQ